MGNGRESRSGVIPHTSIEGSLRKIVLGLASMVGVLRKIIYIMKYSVLP